MYKLNNPTWQAIPIAKLNEDLKNYKMIRIDYISCWWESTEQPKLIGNIFIDLEDVSYTIAYSCNIADWFIYNEFYISDNSIIFKNAKELLNSGKEYEYQTANVYRVVGYK